MLVEPSWIGLTSLYKDKRGIIYLYQEMKQQRDGYLQTRKRFTRSPQFWHSALGLPAWRPVRNQHLLFKSPHLWCSVLAAWADYNREIWSEVDTWSKLDHWVLAHRNLDRAIWDSSVISARNQNSPEGYLCAQFGIQKRFRVKQIPGPERFLDSVGFSVQGPCSWEA